MVLGAIRVGSHTVQPKRTCRERTKLSAIICQLSAGDPEKLWTVDELKRIREEIEDAGLVLAAIENLDPAHWHDILLDGPQRSHQIEKVKTIIRRIGETGNDGTGTLVAGTQPAAD